MTTSVVVFDAISVAICIASDAFLSYHAHLYLDEERPSPYSLGSSQRICTLHGPGVRLAWGIDEATSVAELVVMARLPLVPRISKTSPIAAVLTGLAATYGSVVYATSREVIGDLPARVTAVRVPAVVSIGSHHLDDIFRLLSPGGHRGGT